MEKTVLIDGIGFMGGSLALALKKAKWTVYLHHRRHGASLEAETLGYGTAVEDPKEIMDRCSIAIVCTPVSIIPERVRLLSNLNENAVITDVGSVKAKLANELEDLAKLGKYVGSHPMAGSHLQGLKNANPDLFTAADTAITPHENCPGEAIAKIQALWTSISCSCHRFLPEDHDYAVAEISHLPHILSSATAAALSERGLPIAANGFKDTTRIAAGSEKLWGDILLQNKNAVKFQLENSIKHQKDLLKALEEENLTKVEEWLAIGKQKRGCFEQKSM